MLQNTHTQQKPTPEIIRLRSSIHGHSTHPAFIPRNGVVHWVPGSVELLGSACASEFVWCTFNKLNAADPKTI